MRGKATNKLRGNHVVLTNASTPLSLSEILIPVVSSVQWFFCKRLKNPNRKKMEIDMTKWLLICQATLNELLANLHRSQPGKFIEQVFFISA